MLGIDSEDHEDREHSAFEKRFVIKVDQRSGYRKKIGAGGFAKVFEAEDMQTNKLVAVKEMKWKGREDEIRKETDILSRLHHVNIVKLLGHSFPNGPTGDAYIAMELCTGGELFDAIVNAKALNEYITKQVSMQILAAISYAHSQGIAHMDIKPENIMLATPWQGSSFPQIKLVDWGLASRFDDFNNCPRQCPPKGTRIYTAPEVYYLRNYNEKADLWSIGVVVFIMLNGFAPFDRPPEDQDQTNQGISTMKEYSSLAQSFVFSLLKVDPTLRPSAAEALDAAWLQEDGSKVIKPMLLDQFEQFVIHSKV